MRFAEVLLRLGSALVAWMILYAYALWLAVLHVIGCGPDGDELHRLLLGLVPLVCGVAFTLHVTRPFAETHSMLRWLGVPLFLLLPFALRTVWNIFQTVNLNGTAICSDVVPSRWEILWAPVQTITLIFVSYMIVRVWQSVARDMLE